MRKQEIFENVTLTSPFNGKESFYSTPCKLYFIHEQGLHTLTFRDYSNATRNKDLINVTVNSISYIKIDFKNQNEMTLFSSQRTVAIDFMDKSKRNRFVNTIRLYIDIERNPLKPLKLKFKACRNLSSVPYNGDEMVLTFISSSKETNVRDVMYWFKSDKIKFTYDCTELNEKVTENNRDEKTYITSEQTENKTDENTIKVSEPVENDNITETGVELDIIENKDDDRNDKELETLENKDNGNSNETRESIKNERDDNTNRIPDQTGNMRNDKIHKAAEQGGDNIEHFNYTQGKNELINSSHIGRKLFAGFKSIAFKIEKDIEENLIFIDSPKEDIKRAIFNVIFVPIFTNWTMSKYSRIHTQIAINILYTYVKDINDNSYICTDGENKSIDEIELYIFDIYYRMIKKFKLDESNWLSTIFERASDILENELFEDIKRCLIANEIYSLDFLQEDMYNLFSRFFKSRDDIGIIMNTIIESIEDFDILPILLTSIAYNILILFLDDNETNSTKNNQARYYFHEYYKKNKDNIKLSASSIVKDIKHIQKALASK